MRSGNIEKMGSAGSFAAALACPAYFPAFAVAGAALGLGFFQPFEGAVFIVFCILVLVALAGSILAYLNHRTVLPLVVGIASPAAIFFSVHFARSEAVMYARLAGLRAASVLNHIAGRRRAACKRKACSP